MGFLGGGGGAAPAPIPKLVEPVNTEPPQKRKKGGVRARVSAGRALGRVTDTTDVLRKTLGG